MGESRHMTFHSRNEIKYVCIGGMGVDTNKDPSDNGVCNSGLRRVGYKTGERRDRKVNRGDMWSN